MGAMTGGAMGAFTTCLAISELNDSRVAITNIPQTLFEQVLESQSEFIKHD